MTPLLTMTRKSIYNFYLIIAVPLFVLILIDVEEFNVLDCVLFILSFLYFDIALIPGKASKGLPLNTNNVNEPIARIIRYHILMPLNKSKLSHLVIPLLLTIMFMVGTELLKEGVLLFG